MILTQQEPRTRFKQGLKLDETKTKQEQKKDITGLGFDSTGTKPDLNLTCLKVGLN